MDPFTLSAILAGGGSLLSGLGSSLQANQPYQDATAGWLKQFNGQMGAPSTNRDLNYGNSSALLKALQGGGLMDPNGYLQRATGFTNNASDLYNSILAGYQPGGSYTAQGMQQNFAQMNPGIQNLAGGVANAATSRAGSSMEALARAESNRALNNMQNAMGAGGLFGVAAGPVAASLSQGAQEPLMNAQNRINELYSGAYMGAYNPMSSFAMGNLQAEPAAKANIGQLFGQLAQGQYSAANPLLQLLGGLSEQAFLMPDLQQKQSALAGMLSGIGNTAANLGMFKLGQGWDGGSLGAATPSGGLNNYNYPGYSNPWSAGWRAQ